MNGEALEGEEARRAAEEVLLEAARNDVFAAEYATITRAIDDAGLRDIVNIAWRHQFDQDRYGFKRDIRALQDYVSKRAHKLLEAK